MSDILFAMTPLEASALRNLYLTADSTAEELEYAAASLVEELEVTAERAEQLVAARLREAAAAAGLTTAERDAAIVLASVLDAGVAELVTADTTSAEIAAYAVAAEAGYGRPIPGLIRAMESIRTMERMDSIAADADDLISAEVDHLNQLRARVDARVADQERSR